MDNHILSRKVEFLKGVGSARAEVLGKELQIKTFGDLLMCFPFRYVDRGRIWKIKELTTDSSNYVQLFGEFSDMSLSGKGYQVRLNGSFSDDSGSIDMVWFQGHKWVLEKISPHRKYFVFGKITIFNGKISMAHPEIMSVEEMSASPFKGKLQPVYRSGEKLKLKGLDTRGISKLMKNLLPEVLGRVEETLPRDLLEKLKIPEINLAYRIVHFPENMMELERAQKRFKFEESFYLQLNYQLVRKSQDLKENPIRFEKVGEHFNAFYHRNLSFKLTEAQKRVVREIRTDVNSGRQMNRLLQGDVGSGKTLVALMAMLLAVDNGYQACLMAPTEILAQQHLKTIRNFLAGIPVEVELLTGSTKKKNKALILNDLAEGKINIIIGTHALIEDPVRFQNLGLVVIDEQHRFGVIQRGKLTMKSIYPPHMLVMTATPIPRTLTMTVYGDLRVSVIDELPPGRKPIETIFMTDDQHYFAIELIKRELKAGRQAYIVYPLIKESEKLDLLALHQGYEAIVRDFPLPKYQVGILHGQMKPEDKDMVMQDFAAGRVDILVSTTVIEVGVDVPNASVMMIENAERFGLSQLHQLRGRVGRGAEKSYCILVGGDNLSNDAKIRLSTMVNTNDGFKIAEADLELRGPGDIDGTRQSGMPEFKMLDLAADEKIISFSQQLASEIIEEDQNLSMEKNEIYKRNLMLKKPSAIVVSMIG